MSFQRPMLRTSYEQDSAIFPSWTQRFLVGLTIVGFVLAVFGVGIFEFLPAWFLGSRWYDPVIKAMILGISALGINILVGVTGQVSLGHAFFMGVGAYTAVNLGGEGDQWQACVPWHYELGLLQETATCGLNLPLWIWLPASALMAGLVGVLVAPAAVKVRGLYLAIVTVGLVFIGLHLARTFPSFAGDYESGRSWPKLQLAVWQGEPVLDLASDGVWFGFLDIQEEQKSFLFILVILLAAIWLSTNLVRTRTGRALQAIRDRDVAAEVMGVPEFAYKRLGFAISSAYAGLAGALFASYTGRMSPVDFNLVLSVEFIAILLIGGAGTVLGTLLGTLFVELLPKVVENMTERLAEQLDGGPLRPLAEVLLTEGSGDFGPISIVTTSPGWPMSVYLWNLVIYGLLIVTFLIFEPLGLFGIWLRIRNYWKGFPFSY